MFQLFSISHITILTIAFFLVWLISRFKFAIPRFVEIFAFVFIFSFYILHFLYYYYINGFHPGYDLPIFQICGIVMVNLALFLLTKKQFFYSTVYFLGSTAMTLAFLLPDLHDDYNHPYFWIFWLPHLITLVFVLIVSFNYNFQLTVRDLNQAYAFLLLYLMLFALPFSLVIKNYFGYANYSYMISIPYDIFGIHLDRPFYYPVVLIPTYLYFRLLIGVKNKFDYKKFSCGE